MGWAEGAEGKARGAGATQRLQQTGGEVTRRPAPGHSLLWLRCVASGPAPLPPAPRSTKHKLWEMHLTMSQVRYHAAAGGGALQTGLSAPSLLTTRSFGPCEL